jgi:integrase/recombinase XerD
MTGRVCATSSGPGDALLAAQNRASEQGRQGHGVLVFLYNTGTSASEAAAVTIRDLEARSDGFGSVRLVGKGVNTRHCPALVIRS